MVIPLQRPDVNKKESTTTMPNQHKKVSCKICYKTVRSDNLKRHLKVLLKRNETYPTTKRKHDDDVQAQSMIKKKYKIDVEDLVNKLQSMVFH